VWLAMGVGGVRGPRHLPIPCCMQCLLQEREFAGSVGPGDRRAWRAAANWLALVACTISCNCVLRDHGLLLFQAWWLHMPDCHRASACLPLLEHSSCADTVQLPGAIPTCTSSDCLARCVGAAAASAAGALGGLEGEGPAKSSAGRSSSDSPPAAAAAATLLPASCQQNSTTAQKDAGRVRCVLTTHVGWWRSECTHAPCGGAQGPGPCRCNC
jgi:hypothetical protein